MKSVTFFALLAPFAMAADPRLTSEPDSIDVTLLAPGKPFPNPADLTAQAALPDPLVTYLGRAVKTRGDWEKERAPELRRLFQHYMYGQMPANPAAFNAKVVGENKEALGGKATLKDIDIQTKGPELHIRLLLVVPNKRSGPAPTFVGLNFNGNHALLADPSIRLPESWMRQGSA
ncbi:MAG TPA: hypothetical protein VFD27_04770, partial [Chthoniobacteraceae bacterium]|nr:hypothetical protein [Chthoniobacteraceae bacterium]